MLYNCTTPYNNVLLCIKVYNSVLLWFWHFFMTGLFLFSWRRQPNKYVWHLLMHVLFYFLLLFPGYIRGSLSLLAHSLLDSWIYTMLIKAFISGFQKSDSKWFKEIQRNSKWYKVKQVISDWFDSDSTLRGKLKYWCSDSFT